MQTKIKHVVGKVCTQDNYRHETRVVLQKQDGEFVRCIMQPITDNILNEVIFVEGHVDNVGGYGEYFSGGKFGYTKFAEKG